MNIFLNKTKKLNIKSENMENEIENLKQTLLLLLKEKEKRNRKTEIDLYNSGKIKHLKQMEFHKCLKKNRWVFGGNRTGKTECGAVETVWLARGIHPFRKNKKTDGWVVSVTSQVQRDVAQKKVLKYLKKEWITDIIMQSGSKDSAEFGIIDKILVKNVFNSVSTIGFKSLEQGREKFQGASLNYVWFDEEPTKDIYYECKMRVLDTCGEIFATMTPLKGRTWVYDEIYLNENNDNEIWHEHISWQDNPFLDKEEVSKLTKYTTSDELESRCFGNFVKNAGLVYNNFDESVNVIDPFIIPESWQDNICIDPGFTNPFSCHFYARNLDGDVFVVAEHYEKEKPVEYHANAILEIANNLNWKKDSENNLNCLIDSAALQRNLNSENSVVDQLKKYNIMANTKVNKNIISGIHEVKNYIKDGAGHSRLFIFKNCINMIRELKSYSWGDDKPIKEHDHSMDELRYYIMSLKKCEYKSEIQKDKEKLMKKSKTYRSFLN